MNNEQPKNVRKIGLRRSPEFGSGGKNLARLNESRQTFVQNFQGKAGTWIKME